MRNRIIARLSRLVALGAALLFAGVGLTAWIAPAGAAALFGLEAAGAAGVISLRADLGGLFIGLAIVCGTASWTGRRSWLLAGAAVLGAIASGRVIGWIGNGGPAGDRLALAAELGVIAALALGAISLQMTRSLGSGARDGGRSQTAAIMHDIEDYHITPEQAAQIANEAGAQMLVFYHLLPAPDGYLPRQIFGRGVSEVRRGDWAIADDGSLYTLPLGSREIRIGRMPE